MMFLWLSRRLVGETASTGRSRGKYDVKPILLHQFDGVLLDLITRLTSQCIYFPHFSLFSSGLLPVWNRLVPLADHSPFASVESYFAEHPDEDVRQLVPRLSGLLEYGGAGAFRAGAAVALSLAIVAALGVGDVSAVPNYSIGAHRALAPIDLRCQWHWQDILCRLGRLGSNSTR